jgi:broad specificity phosphatase PhoE
MDRLILVRHALAGSNHGGTASGTAPGEGLTEEGVAQAQALAHTLGTDELALAVTSGFTRTQSTLRLALDGRDVPVVVLTQLNEIDFGSFDGGPLETYRSWAAANSPIVRPPGGESRADAAARFAAGLRAVLARPEALVLLVGHALMLRYTLDAAEGLVPAARMAPVAHASPYWLDREGVERAAELLESWARAPRFRA